MPTNMTSINIKRQNDLAVAWPDITEENFGGQADVPRVGIAEGATTGGKASINFDVVTPDGKHYLVEMTEGIFDMIAASLKGAKQHWAQNPVPNLWKDK